MMCVDASVAAKWILDEEHSEQARALYNACILARQLIVAPPLLAIEVTNILRQRMRREALSLADARSLIAQFRSLPNGNREPPPLY
jgi:predicted nucleic acid-binding protein